jgi:NFU1 iron-sulfur cluster scaffold homolog, mitochondrial
MGFKVKEIQPTPNPNAAKFVLDREIAPQPMSFLNAEQGKDHPLASQLFAIKGVTGILLLGDFVTVNKSPTVKWEQITTRVEEILQNDAPGGRFSKEIPI